MGNAAGTVTTASETLFAWEVGPQKTSSKDIKFGKGEKWLNYGIAESGFGQCGF
jgi:hypothetical protein